MTTMADIRSFGPPLEVVSSCLRGAFRAPAGKQFVACDLSAIEYVVVGWLAQCPTILDICAKGLDPYVSFGTHFFNLPYRDLDPDVLEISTDEKKSRKDRRQQMKPPVLGCGFGLGAGEIKEDKNGDEYKSGLWGYAENMKIAISQADAVRGVDIYKAQYPEVPALWRHLEDAAVKALRTGEIQQVGAVAFGAVKPCKLLYMILPSGRRLHYIRPKLEVEETWDGRERYKISYEGIVTGTKIWGRISTWGGKLTENAVQAIARDILIEAMLRTDDAGFNLVGSTHDEEICLEDIGSDKNLARLREIMIQRPTWAPDIPLDAAGFEDPVYRKE